MGESADTPPKKTPLHAACVAMGARMVPFAGYEMPVQFAGILKEHAAVREAAGVFDVSHMGQIALTGERDAIAAWLEWLTPSRFTTLAPGKARYTVLTTDTGGAVDDFIALALPDRFHLVVNGARREAVAAHFAANAGEGIDVTFQDRALIAVQGPGAEAAIAPYAPGAAALSFMEGGEMDAFGVPAIVTRCGYTGEDGFEISLPEDAADSAFKTLVEDGVAPCGLGARDVLRLEAGLPLYGQDLTEEIGPVMAGLPFVIAKARREAGGFLGADALLSQLAHGADRARVGLAIEGRVPARAGAPLMQGEREVGIVTSGAHSPALGHPIAFALLDRSVDPAPGTELAAMVRGKPLKATITGLPFLPARTKRRTTP